MFINGNKVEETTTDIKKNVHGTSFSFIPNEILMSNGDEGCDIEHEGLHEWLDMISFLLPEDKTICYTYIAPKGKEKNYKFKNDGGQLSYLKKLHKGKFVVQPYHFIDTMEMEEKDRGKTYKRSIQVEVAVGFKNTSTEIIRDSFFNFVNTIDRGTHMDAVEQTIANEIVRETKDTLSERDSKLDISRVDVYSSMVVSVNVITDINPQFSGQVKEKVTSTVLSAPIRDMVRKAMRTYKAQFGSDLEKISKVVRSNCRGRMNMNELKEAQSATKGASNLDLLKEKKYIPPRMKLNKRDYKEILVVEGESAGAPIEDLGFKFQAALQLKGAPINSLTKTPARVMTNDEIRTFITVGRAGVGKSFEVDKFWFDKVIIMSDGDTDGNNIFSSFLMFILIYMPELITQGRVFRVLAPLYEIKDTKRPFILSKREYSEVFAERIGENIKLVSKDGVRVSKPKLMDFLERNENYLEELLRISGLFKVHPDILEFVIMNSEKTEPELVNLTRDTFDEMVWESGNILTGAYQGEFQFIHVNKRFLNKIIPLLEMIAENDELHYDTFIKNGKEYMEVGHLTLGQLLLECEKFKPSITKRFKGLGELEPNDLFDNVLTPSKRILVRVTMDDLDEARKNISLLHGDKKEDRENRRVFIDSHTVRRDEIDN